MEIEGLWNELQATKQQRDELLAALEEVVKAQDECEQEAEKAIRSGSTAPLVRLMQAFNNAKQVIAKVKEKGDGPSEKQATEKRELKEALQSFVNCIETLKANGFQTDWFDSIWINQELDRAKKALGEKG